MKMIVTLSFFFLLPVLSLTTACSPEAQPYDNPFVYINDEGGGSKATISDQSHNLLSELTVSLSTRAFSENISVAYEITVGSGLQEGVDFKWQASTGSPLVFAPGIYSKRIRINWLRHEIDPSLDNTLTISLTACSRRDFTLGLPGPDKLRQIYTFTKKHN